MCRRDRGHCAARSTIITFSAWSFALRRSRDAEAAVPLMGRVSTSMPRSAQVAARARRDDGERAPRKLEPHEGGVRRRVAVDQCAVEADGIRCAIAREATREVDLVALARREQLERLADAVCVFVAAHRREPRVVVIGGDRRGGAGLTRRGEQRVVEPRAARAVALERDGAVGRDHRAARRIGRRRHQERSRHRVTRPGVSPARRCARARS